MSNATQNLALRRLATEQRIDSHRIQQYLETLDVLPAQRYEHTPLLGRISELRHHFTAYDVIYIALAEATGACFTPVTES